MNLTIRGLLLLFLLAGTVAAQEPPAAGAGLTGVGLFPLPEPMAQWVEVFKTKGGVQPAYRVVKSGNILKMVAEGEADFCLTADPKSVEEMRTRGLFQFPVLISAAVFVVNLPGFGSGELRLNGTAVANLFNGVTTRWNAASLSITNPNLAPVQLKIIPVHSRDNTLETRLAERFIARYTPPGKGLDPTLLQKQTWLETEAAVVGYITDTPGAIGYVSLVTAQRHGLTVVALEKTGAEAPIPDAVLLNGMAGEVDWFLQPLAAMESAARLDYPLIGAVYAVIKSDQPSVERGRGLLQFFNWIYTSAQFEQDPTTFIQLPPNLTTSVQAMWAAEVQSGGQPLYP